MKLSSSRTRNPYLAIYDANGTRLEHVVFADTETGRVERFATNAFGEMVCDEEGRIVEVIYPPGPLRVIDTKLNLEITSQLQLDFIERSRASAAEANRRWRDVCERAERVFDQLAYVHGCGLGTPRFSSGSELRRRIGI